MSGSGLSVQLEVPDEVVRGDLVVGRLTVVNTGTESRTLSTRLHLAEGDIALSVTDPAGRTRRVAGKYQVDSPPRRAEVPAGDAVGAGLNLLGTDAGRLFDQPGIYRISPVYHPSVREDALTGPSREVIVRTARDDRERSVSDLLDPAVVGDAFALGDVEPGSPSADSLEGAARLAEGTPAGVVAALVREASAARRGQDTDSLRQILDQLEEDSLGWLVTASMPPATAEGDPLVSVTLDVLMRADTPQAKRAGNIAQGRPFRTRLS